MVVPFFLWKPPSREDPLKRPLLWPMTFHSSRVLAGLPGQGFSKLPPGPNDAKKSRASLSASGEGQDQKDTLSLLDMAQTDTDAAPSPAARSFMLLSSHHAIFQH